RGGGRLPWYAVSASMIATIISAVTFIGVPAISYADDGNFTYLQFGIIAGLLSRTFVALFLVPAYYKYQVYSPYDYMGERLGEAARSVTTAMFTLMGLLAQASRVYLTALVLELVIGDQLQWLADRTGQSPLVWAITFVGAIAIVWTMLGGIATVVWTDAMLFVVFVLGGVVALGVIAAEVPGGLSAVVKEGAAAGKFQLWSFGQSTDATPFASQWGEIFARPFTLWAAIFAVTFGNIGSYGTDQLLAQRIFTCRSQRDAQWAVMSSWLAELVAALMLLVGVGLWAFYRAFPEALVGEAAAAVAEKRDNIFPVFILTQVPVALRGLIVAGIFAAAISSLTSILAALAQTTLSAVYLPLLGPSGDAVTEADSRRLLRVSRVLIVAWGIALCVVAVAIDAYVDVQETAGKPVFFLNLALGLANYGLGTLFAAFLLAWLPIPRNAYGLIWSAPLSVLCVVACRYHASQMQLQIGNLSFNLYWILAIILLGSWLLTALGSADAQQRTARLQRSFWLLIGCGVMCVIANYLWFGTLDPTTGQLEVTAEGTPVRTPIAWPWYAPIGGAVAFCFGWLLGDPTERSS
ncbi:MAG: hypothetical protein AAGF97_07670, partial [Planctomycetota bacterium]